MRARSAASATTSAASALLPTPLPLLLPPPPLLLTPAMKVFPPQALSRCSCQSGGGRPNSNSMCRGVEPLCRSSRAACRKKPSLVSKTR